MQSSNAEQLLACQAQKQPKNALSLPPPFVGGFLVAGSGTVPNPALELPLWRGLVAGGFRVCPRSRADSPRGRGLRPLLATSQTEFSSRTGSTSIRVPICLQLTPFYLPPTLLHYGHS